MVSSVSYVELPVGNVHTQYICTCYLGLVSSWFVRSPASFFLSPVLCCCTPTQERKKSDFLNVLLVLAGEIPLAPELQNALVGYPSSSSSSSSAAAPASSSSSSSPASPDVSSSSTAAAPASQQQQTHQMEFSEALTKFQAVFKAFLLEQRHVTREQEEKGRSALQRAQELEREVEGLNRRVEEVGEWMCFCLLFSLG